VVTGSSGFLGRHLLDAFKEDYRIFGIARRSQQRAGAPVHPNITWFEADISSKEQIGAAFRQIQDGGGADVLIHLAAHYDFTGEEHETYTRTNIDGHRNVLDLSRGLGLKLSLFSSSTAACGFPPPGGALDEDSPPNGDHIYARTKRVGEAMLAEYADSFPSVTIRFAAIFSEWCEYAPLFFFVENWLANAWNSRILGGRGLSAIPYLHVRDAVSFVRTLLARRS
jgi:nucleoside-diphosphate-sugar epimerase